MADKIFYGSLDVSEIIRNWLFKGEKGTYVNVTFFYSETPDKYGNNGMVIQSVPKEIREGEIKQQLSKDKMTRGPILGNFKEQKAKMGVASDDKSIADEIGVPVNGATTTAGGAPAAEPDENLPF